MYSGSRGCSIIFSDYRWRFERRKLGDIQSRFDSLDTLRATFTTSVIGFIMDSIMVVGVCVMMLLYGGYLTWIVLCFTTIYILFDW